MTGMDSYVSMIMQYGFENRKELNRFYKGVRSCLKKNRYPDSEVDGWLDISDIPDKLKGIITEKGLSSIILANLEREANELFQPPGYKPEQKAAPAVPARKPGQRRTGKRGKKAGKKHPRSLMPYYVGGGVIAAAALAALISHYSKVDVIVEPAPRDFNIDGNPQYRLETQDGNGNKTYTLYLSGKAVRVVYGGTEPTEFRKGSSLADRSLTIIIPDVSDEEKREYDKYNWKMLIGFDDSAHLGGSMKSEKITMNVNGEEKKVKVKYWDTISGRDPKFSEIFEDRRDRSLVMGLKPYEERMTSLENQLELLKRTRADKWKVRQKEKEIRDLEKEILQID
jgi:hypothetical protein